MSVTALTMIKRAMRIMRVASADQEPTAGEAADGLYALNAMMDSWSIERLMVYQVAQSEYSWPSSTRSRTIGSGGDFNTTRPTKVAEMGNFFRDLGTNIDYPLFWLGDRSAYDLILLKTTTSTYPQWIFVDTGYPLMTLYVWPVPTMTLQLHLNHWKPLQNFATLNAAISMPPGYQAAIEFNLADWWRGEFGSAAQMTAEDVKRAAVLKQAIRGLNHPDLVAQLDSALFNRGQPYNIYTDGGVMANVG